MNCQLTDNRALPKFCEGQANEAQADEKAGDSVDAALDVATLHSSAWMRGLP
jgi:hypothetical protein